MSKIDRRHQARQKQQLKYQEHVKSTSIFSGQNGAPRNVAIIPLTQDGNATKAIKLLNDSLDLPDETPPEGFVTIRVDRFKQNIRYMPVQRDLIPILDACRLADFVIFILSPIQEVDEYGELLLRAIENQGLPNSVTTVQYLDQIEPAKRRPHIITSLKSYITHFLPSQEKVHSLDSPQDCANVIRSLCTTVPKGINWREDRSWMLVEDIKWPGVADVPPEALNEVIVTGVVRGKGLKANNIVHVGDWGDFHIEKITTAPSSNGKKRKAGEMAVDTPNEETVLEKPNEHQHDLSDLAPDDLVMDDVNDIPTLEAPAEKRGVLLDDHHYFSDDDTDLPQPPTRLPKGTSAYQAAWFLDDVSESESSLDEIADDDGDLSMSGQPPPRDGLEDLDQRVINEDTEAGPSEYPQSEMFLDPSPNEEADQIAEYRSKRKAEAEDDLEFPDEIELHPNVLARERLARYRGLKSLRTSNWETHEDKAHEPEEWNRLLQVANHNSAKKHAIQEALVGGVRPGTRVNVYLRNVPAHLKSSHTSSSPLGLFSLLTHEHKRTVMNFTITLNSDYPNPIKSKEELILQCGPRRMVINPLFSQTGNTPNNVHKVNRYLHPGQTTMATCMAPLTWGSVPVLFFKRSTPTPSPDSPATTSSTPSLELIATGTSQPPDQTRVIAKRVILTGHPYKIHKKLVTIRYMFFNPEDVNWFKALQLWTKRGRSGYIKESLGTHGYFKATFDGRINPQDAVGVSLYKRVFPPNARAWRVDEDGRT